MLNSQNCAVVITELVPTLTFGTAEAPDAIGFAHDRSILLECKVSRSDFLADRKKVFRVKPELGMGCYRYYLAPPGVLAPEEIPDRWGLLVAYPARILTLKKAQWFPRDKAREAEQPVLATLAMRIPYLAKGEGGVYRAKRYDASGETRYTVAVRREA